MPAEDITLGELSRGIVALEKRLGEQFASVNRRLDNLQFVSRDVHDEQLRQVNQRLDDLEESKKWTGRAFVAAFIYPLLVAAVVAAALTR